MRVDRIVQLLINAAALYVAVLITPLEFDFGPPDAWWKFLLVALIFGLVNTFLKPVLRILTLPITIMTHGHLPADPECPAPAPGQRDLRRAQPRAHRSLTSWRRLLGAIVISIVGFILSMVIGTGRMAGKAL